MILLIDAGNTRIKWCVADDREPTGPWLAEGALAHDAITDLGALCSRFPKLRAAAGTNVAGPSVAEAIERSLASRPLGPVRWFTATAAAGGIRNGYEHPRQLGADRWAALIGARSLHAGACLVVTAGTATTIDILDGEGLFRGGVILPGLELMRSALARNTAQLPFAEGRFVPTPRRTADAIISGCLHAQAGAVERMFRMVSDMPGAVCLLNGGAARAIAPLLDVPLREVDNLVLRGIATLLATGDGD